ncbi:MAG: SpoIIE family protein phosphatase [Acidimicrobiia bacterium]
MLPDARGQQGARELRAPTLARWAGPGAVAVVLALGVLGTAVVWGRESAQAKERDTQAAARAASALAVIGIRNVETLRGADALLADDGVISAAELDALATGVLSGSALPALAHEIVVEADDRAGFEAEYGFPMIDAVASGRFVPSAERPLHYPVVAVSPANETSRAVLGLDIRSDPERLEAADRAVARGAPTLSAPIRLNPSGRLGYFVVVPLQAPNVDGTSTLVGFLSAAFTVDDALALVRADVPDGTELSLRDGERVLVDEAREGELTLVDVGGRTLEVRADETTGRNPIAALLVALASVALAGLVALATRQSFQHQRAVEGLAEQLEYKRLRAQLLAEIGRDLSAATSRDGVLDIVATKFAHVLGADTATIGIIEDGAVHTFLGTSEHEDIRDRFGSVPLDARLPATDAIRANDVSLELDLAAYRAGGDELADVTTTGMRSAAAVPIHDPDGKVTGVLGFGWTSPPPTPSLEPTLRTIGDMCSQTLGRVDVQQMLARRSAALSELSGALAAAATSRDVQICLMGLAAQPVGAIHANFVLHDPASGELVLQLPPLMDTTVAERYSRIGVDAELPVAVTFRTNRPVFITDLDDCAARFPDFAPDAVRSGFVASAALPLRRGSATCIGAIGFAWDRAVHFDDPMVSTLQTIADLSSQTLERARLWDEQQADGRRAQALADLGRALAAAGNERDAVRIMADRIAIVVGAEFANVSVLDADGTTLRIMRNRGGADNGVHALPFDERLPQAEAIRTASPVLLADRGAYASRYPHLLDEIEADGIHAALFWPLLDEQRGAIGALGVAWTRPTSPEYTELATISTVADLCVRALERARLTDGRVREARGFARLAQSLTEATSSADVRRAVAAGLAQVVDARRAMLVLPGAAPPAEAELPESAVTMPVSSASGDVLGELRVEWTGLLRDDDARTAMLETLSDLISQTLERVRLYETEHEVVVSLQHQVLGDPPRLDRLDVAARYRPASRIVSIGGDWYDIIELSDGAVALVIGDVVGHGVSAITTMTQIRTTVRGLVRAGTDLKDIFWRASDMLTDGPDMLATAGLFVLDRMRTTVQYCSAGHPPAMLRRPDGTTHLLDAALQRPLGCSARGDHIGTVDFPEGSSLLLYTDGLVERRGEPLSVGIDRLRARLASLPRTGLQPDLLDALIEGMIDADDPSTWVDDDLAAVLVSHAELPA